MEKRLHDFRARGFRSVWRIAIAMITMMLWLPAVGAPADVVVHGQITPKCAPGHSHVLIADARAQVYELPDNEHFEGPDIYLGRVKDFWVLVRSQRWL